MIRALVLCLSVLAAPPPDEPEGKGRLELHEEYDALRDKARDTADAQWKLALWCDQNGLKDEALVHLASVVRLDPKREAAWRKLGFKKHEGRWLTDEQLAAEDARKAAFRLWVPRLAKWHAQIHGGKKQAEAATALAAIDDPAAVPAVYAVLGKNGPIDQAIAVQIFGQILGRESTKVLAVLAVYGASDRVRKLATETLRQREPDDYLAILVNLLVDPLRFEVRPVGGPGSPGVLLVEGEKFNVRRFYAPPPPPAVSFQPGDSLSYDEFGLPVITRMTDSISGKNMFAAKDPYLLNLLSGVRIDTGRNIVEALNGAVVAQSQLANDVGSIRATNVARKAFSDHVMDVIRSASGEDVGKTPRACRAWFADRDGYAREGPEPAKPRSKQTVDVLVPLAYQPEFGQRVSYLTRSLTPPDN